MAMTTSVKKLYVAICNVAVSQKPVARCPGTHVCGGVTNSQKEAMQAAAACDTAEDADYETVDKLEVRDLDTLLYTVHHYGDG
jgi:hypothetical protein